MKKSYIYILTLLSVCSCYTPSDQECKVSNLSSKNLIIHFRYTPNYLDTLINLNSQQTQIISKQGSPLSLKETKRSYCSQNFQLIDVITTDSTQTLTKNWQNKNNWILTKDKDKNLCTCIFEIDDGDLQ